MINTNDKYIVKIAAKTKGTQNPSLIKTPFKLAECPVYYTPKAKFYCPPA